MPILTENLDFFKWSQEWIAPIVGGIFAVVTGVLAYITSRRNAKKGNIERRAPDVQEMWVQQEADRRSRQVMEDIFWDLRSAFKSYFRRVSTAILGLNLTKEQTEIFSLTATEKKAIDATPPVDPVPTETGK